jgi:hypothetical protein
MSKRTGFCIAGACLATAIASCARRRAGGWSTCFRVTPRGSRRSIPADSLPEKILERVVIEQVLRLDDLSLPEGAIRREAANVGLCMERALVTRRRSMTPPA